MESIVAIVRDYAERMIQEVQGMKVLVLDKETMGILSLALSQSETLRSSIFLFEKIDQMKPSQDEFEKYVHMNAIYFIRPTEDNVYRLSKEICTPRYGQYHLFFSNKIDETWLKKIANADKFDVIKSVYEIFADYYPIDQKLFHLNLPNTISLALPNQNWQQIDLNTAERISQSLFALLMSLRRRPVIRYLKSSQSCQFVADKVEAKLRAHGELAQIISRGGHKTLIDGVEQNCQLIIYDRREDPVTPILNQWTYQAMVHELIGIDNNKVDLKQKSEKQEQNVLVLSADTDEFYKKNMFSNFGDLAMSIQTYVQEYQQAHKSTTKVENIEDMKRFMETFPEFQRLSGNVAKHVTITGQMDKLVNDRQLLTLSELEQEIACNDNRNDQFKQIEQHIQNPGYNNFDKLRLVLLYALRYENDERINNLKQLLLNQGVKETQVTLIDAILKYGGASERSGDLFSNKNLLARAKSNWKMMAGVPNVYTQHQSLLSTLFENISKNKLKESEFASTTAFNSREKVTEAIVFIIGGATYEEAKEVALHQNMNIILGGTYMHSSKSFLAEVSQLLFTQ